MLDPISEEIIWKKKSPKKWSAGECIQHLIVTGQHVTRATATAIQQGHDRKTCGDPPFRYGWFNRYFIRQMEPGAFPQLPAPRLYLPRLAKTNKNKLIDDYSSLQEEFISLMDQSEGLDLKRVKVRSPAIAILRLSLGASFLAMEAHQRRHIAQAQRAFQDS